MELFAQLSRIIKVFAKEILAVRWHQMDSESAWYCGVLDHVGMVS